MRRDSIRRAALAVSLLLVAGLVAVVSPFSASAAPKTEFRADRAVPRACHAGRVTGAGVDSYEVSAPAAGLVRIGLASDDGDWDVAVFDKATGRAVAASAGQRSNELADGYVTAGQQLVVQGCRYAGRTRTVKVATAFHPAPAVAAAKGPVQLVRVHTPTRADKGRLQQLDLDLAEAATETSVDVVLHGDDDAATLRGAGFSHTVVIADLAQHVADARRADAQYKAGVARSGLPSGRTEYRRLADYDYELKELARKYPLLVRPMTLDRKSLEGRDIAGVEIALGADNIADGKPVFLNMGVHHAREWPAGEHPMEWAYELLQGFGKDQRTTRLVSATRNIVIPIVNPDGFNASREAPPRGDFTAFDYEMKRKNCQPKDAPTVGDRGGICPQNPAGRLRGTDLNRNYAGWWGGPGASTNWRSDTYRGSVPFSEPETQGIRELISSRQVTNLITNHTYSNLVLRPPGVMATGQPVDELLLRGLGQQMSDRNGYANIRGFQLYDTTGTTEDWSYWITGGLGYTFEIGPSSFHPPYRQGVVDEYLGTGSAAGAGKGGNREAYFAMLESTANPAHHAVLTGWAPPGFTLRAHREFQTPTSPVRNPDGTVGPPILYSDTLDSTLTPWAGGFTWHLNPSTRPHVAGRYGRVPAAPPSPTLSPANPPGQPAENPSDPLGGPHEAIPFVIAGPPVADNGKVTVHIEWTNPATDWDLFIVNDKNQIVGQSAQGGTRTEDAILIDPEPGNYRAIIVNYDQVNGAPYDDWSGGSIRFESPTPAVIGVKEAWVVTCERPNGAVAAVRHVVVDRGQKVDLGNACRRKA